MSDRLSDLLARRAEQGSGVHPTRAGVDEAIAHRAIRRRRRRTIGGGIGVVVVLAVAGVAVAAGGSTDADPESGIATQPEGAENLPLVGIDLVGYTRAPELDPDPSAGGDDLTYAAFTGDEPDVLGPMITASSVVQTGDTDPGGIPVDLDGDGDAGGESDGRMTEYENGATTVTWTHDSTPPPYGRIAVVNGHGVPPEDVLIYAQQLSGVPFDLETMPAPERLPHREVVTFEPTPDFPSRVASYQGPSSVVHVLTTDDPGYFDLTRIVSTEGQQYEEISLGRTFLGPGSAILSPDDDGTTSALVRTESGLTVHAFGRNVDADTLRTAIRYGHLVDLSDEGHPLATTVPATTVPATTVPAPETPPVVTAVEGTGIIGFDVQFEDITIRFAGEPAELVDAAIGQDWDPRCEIDHPSLASNPADDWRRLVERGEVPDAEGFVTLTFAATEGAVPIGRLTVGESAYVAGCDDGDQEADATVLAFPLARTPADLLPSTSQDPAEVFIDLVY